MRLVLIIYTFYFSIKLLIILLIFIGNVYIADTSNNRIRKVTVSTGIITTIAGTGSASYSGDNGAATSATLNNPFGVSLDASGNVYIADSDNNRIRKVTVSTGIISTIAGTGSTSFSGDNGAATSAALYYPFGVSVDSSGNVYIADYFNHRIRKVSVSTGIIITIAGTGTAGYSGDNGAATSATLYYPVGVSLDASGNVYIADTNNNRIRKVTVSTGIISTIAGTGTGSYSGDYGAATSATLYYPFGVSLDASGNVYIADSYNNRIRKVTVSTGIISTIAGTGSTSYSGDNGAATSAALYYPVGVSLDSSGNVYIADSDNNRIRKISVSSATTNAPSMQPMTVTNLPTMVPTSLPTALPTRVPSFMPSILPTSVSSDSIISTIAGTGTTSYSGDGGAATSASLYSPGGVTIDASGT